MNRFTQLVKDIKKALGPSSGLTSDDVKVQDLTDIMERYTSKEEDWSKYAMEDPDMAYTRNLVDEGNGKANLLILVWTPGKGSPIHDHGKAHCLMKILRGSLTETRYEFPDGDKEKQMKLTSETVLANNEVGYMSDELGLHSMSNYGSNYAVSLHLYTPPNVAKYGCNIFDGNTGKKTHIAKCGNYSARGKRIDEKGLLKGPAVKL
ncbi:RmlC-like cupin domain-containing protein [Hypoxylon rubiginosum]|uniref:RmlC-like cupin domain-containing protein n=1 Tax=Hypoxylon rubiginosum TaxID=110542 RepID=A0ACB9Z884_9PEZI|nr:RmlC-like cupin domain-containing protein [Hypoxylon rubiginosum]